MTCTAVRNALLQADSPEQTAQSAGVREHLAGCGACRQLLADIVALENSWRTQPTPAGCETSKQSFLKRLGTLSAKPGSQGETTSAASAPISAPASAAPRPAAGRRLPPWRWVVAASLLVALLLGGWLAMPGGNAAAGEVMVRLVDWNVALAEARPEERPQLFAAHEEDLRRLVQTASLSAEDRDLAGSLLETGAALSNSADPLDAAGRLDRVADAMEERVARAARTGDAKNVEQWTRQFAKFQDRAIKPQLDHSGKKGQHPQTPAQAERLQTLAAKTGARHDALVHLANGQAEPIRQQIHHALGHLAHPAKKNHKK